MIKISTLATEYIKAQYGWAVSEQFSDTFKSEQTMGIFDTQPFEEQNVNALIKILQAVQDLIDSDLFTEEAISYLVIYKEELTHYLDAYTEE